MLRAAEREREVEQSPIERVAEGVWGWTEGLREQRNGKRELEQREWQRDLRLKLWGWKRLNLFGGLAWSWCTQVFLSDFKVEIVFREVDLGTTEIMWVEGGDSLGWSFKLAAKKSGYRNSSFITCVLCVQWVSFLYFYFGFSIIMSKNKIEMMS